MCLNFEMRCAAGPRMLARSYLTGVEAAMLVDINNVAVGSWSQWRAGA